MAHKINLALQVLPSVPSEQVYAVVDEAIAVIQASGLKYRVCPFETVIEGTYDECMEVVRKAQEVCFKAGASQLLVYIKMQIKKDEDVSIEDKTGKYD
ncbi:MAG TPA: thiamine-binding protein [Chitinophaga sp.]|nr:thiamine-binding protein [Chitinophaga sp.]